MFKQFSRLPLFLFLAVVPIATFWLGYLVYPRVNFQPSETATTAVVAQRDEIGIQQAAGADTQSTDSAGTDRVGDGAAEDGHAEGESVQIAIENPYAPDAETVRLFDEAWQILERDFYGEKPPTKDRAYRMIRALTESFEEPNTFFIEPEPRAREQEQLRGSFGGIGAYIETLAVDEGNHFSLRPMRGQPADLAGIVEGDRLIAVDGTEILLEMVADDVVALVRGPLDTKVALQVRRGGDSDGTPDDGSDAEELTITVVRSEIQVPSVEWRVLDSAEFDSAEFDSAEFAEAFDQTAETSGDAEPVIGYLKQTIFNERSPDETRQALTELQAEGATHFILDLRGNPGGLVSSVVAITDLWLDEGIILREEKADGSEQVYDASPEKAVGKQPIAIIVDGGSASASEILAGALRDHDRATLIGEKTFGKGTVQLIRELPDGSSIHVTNAAWFTPNNHKLEGEGLTPDLVIEPGSDPLPQAIGVLLSVEE